MATTSKLVLLAGVFLALAGCASIDSSDYRQTVLVTTSPPGAVIYDHRGVKLGVSPAYVRVRRRHHPQIIVEMPGQSSKRVDLKSHYRWGDSFSSNFIILTYAPIGWLVDWLTGTAWKMDDPPDLKFAGKGTERVPVIAIAPPESYDRDASEAIGEVLEYRLRSDRGNVLDYDKTAPLFDYYSSGQGLSEKKTQRYNLFYELKADRVLTSTAVASEDGYEVKSELKNVYTGKTESSSRWEVTPADASLKDNMSAHKYYLNYFHLLPNTVFLNFSAFSTALSVDGASYRGKSTRGNGFSDRALDYLSAISVGHLERPRSNVRGHWKYEFVPTMIVSQRKIEFPDYSLLRNVSFERWYVSGGYGIEVGHLSYVGYFYLDLIPMGTWTRLSLRTPAFQESLSRTWLTFMEEIGYTYFFNSHLIGKLYLRSLSEDQALWKNAVRDITGRESDVSGAASSYAGFALGYYFPSTLKDHKEGWRVNSSRAK